MRLLTSIAVLALAGCTTVQVNGVPEHLLLDCPAPETRARTNGDLSRTVLAYKAALKNCNDDKAALREWAKENK